MTARQMILVSAVVTLACAGLGAWLGTALADDAGSVVAIAAACGVLGSFAPGAIRWVIGAARQRGRTAR